jgi:hypothetical protein
MFLLKITDKGAQNQFFHARAGPNQAAVTVCPALVTGHLVGVHLDQVDGSESRDQH